jgi:hypothetical protein
MLRQLSPTADMSRHTPLAAIGQEETFWPLPISWKASVDFVLELPAGRAEVLFSAAASEPTAGGHPGNLRLFEGAIRARI